MMLRAYLFTLFFVYCAAIACAQTSDTRLDIRSFGAIADDGRLDRKAIQEALLACGQQRSVYIPRGVYILDMELDVPSDCEIYGEGPNTSILRADGVTQFGLNFTPSTINDETNGGIISIYKRSNVIIRDLQIDGQEDTKNDARQYGIEISESNNIWISNVFIHDIAADEPITAGTFGDCINIGKVDGGTILSSNIMISNARLFDCQRVGIAITAGTDIAISNTLIDNNNTPNSCIDIEPDGTDLSEDIVVSNIVCQNSQAGGIGIAKAGGSTVTVNNVSIVNNVVRNITNIGISVAGNNITVVGNTIEDAQTGTDTDGCITIDGGERITIADNVVNDCGEHGIHSRGGMNVSITGNIIQGSNGAGIFLAGARGLAGETVGYSLIGNIVYDNGKAPLHAEHSAGILINEDNANGRVIERLHIVGNKSFDARGGSATQDYGLRICSSSTASNLQCDSDTVESNTKTWVITDNIFGPVDVSGAGVTVKGDFSAGKADIEYCTPTIDFSKGSEDQFLVPFQNSTGYFLEARLFLMKETSTATSLVSIGEVQTNGTENATLFVASAAIQDIITGTPDTEGEQGILTLATRPVSADRSIIIYSVNGDANPGEGVICVKAMKTGQ